MNFCMQQNEKIDDKYLFRMKFLDEKISAFDYIERVIQYEVKNDCHIDNRNFNKNSTLFND